jgi:lysophospholipase L1-like esterase
MNTIKTRWAGAMISLLTVLACIGTAELVLQYLAPVSDPHESAKTKTEPNQYIRSELPRNYRVETQAEEGLPGVNGINSFSTNNMGFRGEYLVSPKPHHEFRIFLVGGSTTECFYLDDSQSINRRLQDELNTGVSSNIKVYNAGKSGDALPDHISMIVHRVVHLQPDMIVLFSGINDLTRSIYNYDYLHYSDERSHRLSLFTLLKLMSTEFQIPRRVYYLKERVVPKPPSQILEQVTLRSNYRQKARLRMSTPVASTKPRVDLEPYIENLQTIVGVTKAHGIQLIFITQQSTWNSQDPKLNDWKWMLYRFGVNYREDLMDQALESFNNVMRQVAAKHSVPTYDLARLMPKSSNFFYDDAHFNVRGAREAGVGLASFIKTRGLIAGS